MSEMFLEKSEMDIEGHQISRKEQNVEITIPMYKRFLMYRSYWHIIATILLFFVCEGTYSIYLRILGLYSQQIENKELFQNDSEYWVLLLGIILLYFLLSFAKFMALSLTITACNVKIHQDMIYSLVRSHSWFFDVIPSGVLSNIFSNDIGVLDNSLIFTFQQAF